MNASGIGRRNSFVRGIDLVMDGLPIVAAERLEIPLHAGRVSRPI